MPLWIADGRFALPPVARRQFVSATCPLSALPKHPGTTPEACVQQVPASHPWPCVVGRIVPLLQARARMLRGGTSPAISCVDPLRTRCFGILALHSLQSPLAALAHPCAAQTKRPRVGTRGRSPCLGEIGVTDLPNGGSVWNEAFVLTRETCAQAIRGHAAAAGLQWLGRRCVQGRVHVEIFLRGKNKGGAKGANDTPVKIQMQTIF